MKPQFNHDLLTSFYLWLDNRITKKGEAYINVTGSLFLQSTPSVNGNTYVSPYRGWIYDSCVSGANIPSGFYNSSGQFLTRQSGLVIDFNNGRVITSAKWGPTLSGVYARKEVNIYQSNDNEAKYVLESIFGENPNLSYTLTGMPGNVYSAPLIIITNADDKNIPFALGGLENSTNIVRAYCISNSNYLQEGINSLCRDASDSYIPLASYADMPISSSGDLKGVNWSYCTGIYDKYGCNGIWIEKVRAQKINDRTNGNATFFLSVMEFDLSTIRNTKNL